MKCKIVTSGNMPGVTVDFFAICGPPSFYVVRCDVFVDVITTSAGRKSHPNCWARLPLRDLVFDNIHWNPKLPLLRQQNNQWTLLLTTNFKLIWG